MFNNLSYQLGGAALISSFMFSPVAFNFTLSRNNQILQVAQATQKDVLTQKFYDLIITSKSSISSLQGSVKSLTYNQDFSKNLIKIAGKLAYGQMLAASQKAVARDIEEVKQAQQELKEFINNNEEFVMSLSPEVRQQTTPILVFNIPRQIKVWQKEQHQQNQMWSCSAVRSAPVCY